MNGNSKRAGHRVGQEKLSSELSVRMGRTKRNYRIPYSLKVALRSSAKHFGVSESELFRNYLPIMRLTKKMQDDGLTDNEIHSIINGALNELLSMFDRVARQTVH